MRKNASKNSQSKSKSPKNYNVSNGKISPKTTIASKIAYKITKGQQDSGFYNPDFAVTKNSALKRPHIVKSDARSRANLQTIMTTY